MPQHITYLGRYLVTLQMALPTGALGSVALRVRPTLAGGIPGSTPDMVFGDFGAGPAKYLKHWIYSPPLKKGRKTDAGTQGNCVQFIKIPLP